MNKTFIANPKKIKREWYLIDAKGKILGRVATQVAGLLLGKHKSVFTPHLDCGDYVVIINAKDIRVSGRKMKQKLYKRYSGYPGGLKQTPLEEVLKSKPTEVLKHAVKGMLPKGPLGRDIFKKLKVYAGTEHSHQAQNPKILE
ncbi:MAG: 50S ribosomal protein L13 [Candidatus Omnitrophica bacterium]|nr:50S ribosomal protein L13 [Candidatus Omnitrophota bacterium]